MADRSNLYVVSLIALVAVVGIVTLFMNNAEAPAPVVVDEGRNIVGEAFYKLPAKYRKGIEEPMRVIPVPRLDLPQKKILPQCVYVGDHGGTTSLPRFKFAAGTGARDVCKTFIGPTGGYLPVAYTLEERASTYNNVGCTGGITMQSHKREVFSLYTGSYSTGDEYENHAMFISVRRPEDACRGNIRSELWNVGVLCCAPNI